MTRWTTLNKIIELYTSDLSYKEVERLIKREAPGVYEFYARGMKKPEEHKNSLKRAYTFVRNLFLEFLLRLTPLRRLFYSVALFFFIWGYFTEQWNPVFTGFVMLNVLLAFELADKLTAKDELYIAREIQNDMMPAQAPEHTHFEMACYSETAQEVGGDYFDFIASDKDANKLYLIIGDISGKGMGAALHMVQVQAILKYIILDQDCPKAILCALNKHIRKILKPDNFFTATLAAMNNSGEIEVVRAGHTPILHFRAKNGEITLLTPIGLGIGLPDHGVFDKVLEETIIKTEPGDILYFYTDGVTETMNQKKDLYGDEELRKTIKRNAHKTPKEIQEAILQSLYMYRNSEIPTDDLTMIVMKRKSQNFSVQST